MIRFNNPSFESLSAKEWIVTNGIGGYASGTLSGANTRRYHGLLVASFHPPTDRRVIVSTIEEVIRKGELAIPVSTNKYPGTVHPDGYRLLKVFERDPLPKWFFESGEMAFTKTVFMVYGTNTTVIEYENTSDHSFQLQLAPLLVYRDYHHLMHESAEFDFSLREEKDHMLKITPAPGLDPFNIFFEAGTFSKKSDWYRNFEYLREMERGLDFHEDAKLIGHFSFELHPGDKARLILTAEQNLSASPLSLLKSNEEQRLLSLKSGYENKFLNDLIVSGDQFQVWRLSSKSYTLIAGYHWFTDWGRDTMIAMRGLILATEKKKIAESVFLTFLSYLDDGLIPNRFPDQGERPEYNTIDATLWMFIALFEYYQKFEDLKFIEDIFPSLTTVIESHYAGTKYNIHVTKEGLLYGGGKNTQLTWMDAKVGDHNVTPRYGCPVEINALWFNVLNIYVEFGELLGEPVAGYKNKIVETGASFRKYFFNGKGYLNDVVIPGEMINDDIRPNQVYAISLPFTPLSHAECKSVMSIIEAHLYTDLGLRSLSPQHPDFRPVYTGDQWHRDHAYHQGTVWAFLWGEYGIAYLKVHHYSVAAKNKIRESARALEHHFYNEDGIYAISEIFDGENPAAGKGCIQQAWSIGMTIRALIEAEG